MFNISTLTTNINKRSRTDTYFLKLLNTKQSMIYGVGNMGTGYRRQTQNCGDVKPVNGILSFPT